MRHIIFQQSECYPIALLVKPAIMQAYKLEQHYLNRMPYVDPHDVIAMSLEVDDKGKTPVGFIKSYLAQLLPALDGVGTKLLYVTDSAYFKVLTKAKKAEPHYGYVLPCAIPGYEHMQIVLGMNYQQLVYDPSLEPRLKMTLDTLSDAHVGQYTELGQGIIHKAHYPSTLFDIKVALASLHQYPAISCDIEAFSLAFDKAGIGTIGFAWSKHEGIAFACDYHPYSVPVNGMYGEYRPNLEVRRLLRDFFVAYKGRIRWHNANYDLKPIIFNLWMEHFLDIKGMLTGLDIMTQAFDDTKIITYLATNSTAGNSLGLKDQAHEFAGNYAQEDIKDIRKIPLPELLEYNLVDSLCTNFVFEKHYVPMLADDQGPIYQSLMLPSVRMIAQMELCGMPLDQVYVAKAKAELTGIEQGFLKTFLNNPIITALEKHLTDIAWQKDYESRKAKAKNPDKIFPKERQHFPVVQFNPNSNNQLQILLYEQLGFPVIDLTDGKQPATGGDTLEKLKNHTQNQAYLDILDALIGHIGVTKILSAFIPAFEAALPKADGLTYLHGNFNLGGTVSGRLSSSKPNLQQIPSGSQYAKIIKKCFRAPKGWLMCGADFNSLEDYISALTTKDPNKLKVYTDGYEGHCLRAFSYFPDRLPGIINTVDSINSIKKKFPDIRQLSKTPTFALTYAGTYITLMKNLGFDEATAKKVEAAYHELYCVSDAWVKAKMDQAAKDGYVDVAFGLRVRTPLLAQVIRGQRSTPYQAEAEARTAGNALGQSYGLLNNRAANAFMQKVWDSEFRYDILPIALIHDAIYLLVRDDLKVIAFVNKHLIKEMQWQELPEIQHDTVKLGAEIDIFWPSWADPITIPNDASTETILQLCSEHYQENLAA
ncbi:DNA polymerase [Vreelandella venusta]|uniref:DNA polymerase n=1 Tax=Vreelandella venusta TaxID=44935 RepID=UPI0011749FFC|nr:DNA polymerase [Halomonas venusta]GEK52394.1 hypothetical protein HVE01_31150 [Halomonas venusta]